MRSSAAAIVWSSWAISASEFVYEKQSATSLGRSPDLHLRSRALDVQARQRGLGGLDRRRARLLRTENLGQKSHTSAP